MIFILIFLVGLIIWMMSKKPDDSLGWVVLNSADPNYVIPSMSKRVRILLPIISSGLAQDAAIYHRLIPNSYIVYVGSPRLSSEANVDVDVNLYLENLFPVQFFPAKERWIMVNQEYLFNYQIDRIDYFLCKTRYSHDLIIQHGLDDRTFYLGHTSLNLNPIKPKNPHLCLHLAGQSSLKNTHLLIETWIDHRGFGNNRLIVTCRGGCFDMIRDLIKRLAWRQDHWEDLPSRLFIYPTLPEKEYQEYLDTASVFICPSIVEGYGHYINEGRSRSALVVTTNFPPMNHLIHSDEGVLIQVEGDDDSSVFTRPHQKILLDGKSKGCRISKDGLSLALLECFSLSEQDRAKRAGRGYQHYLNDTDEFRSNLRAFLSSR